MAGRQGADAAIDGVGFRDAAQQQEADEGSGVGSGVGVEVGAQGLDLGGEGESAGVVAVVEGFDAVGVAGQPQGALGGVPEGEGVHAAQALEQVFAPVPVAVEQDFGVAVGMENAAGALQLLAQFAEVVDFAVEDQYAAAGGVDHRLIARGAQVEDGQPPVAEQNAPVGGSPLSVGVGSALAHGLAQAVQALPVGGVGGALVGK